MHRSRCNPQGLTAAAQMGGDVHVLVAGNKAEGAAAQAARLAGVKKVCMPTSAALERPVAEPMAATIVALAGAYDHIVAPPPPMARTTCHASRPCST